MGYMNVKEKWFYYDTVMVSPWVGTLSHPIPGWYSSFSNLATSDAITFFNSRNKAIGLAYNNQDARDQLPFALVAETVSIGFFGPSAASLYGTPCPCVRGVKGRVDFLSAWWEDEVPQHTSAVFKVNQDERLKTNCAMLPASYGPTGFAQGQGDTSTLHGNSASVNAGGMGTPHLKYRWEFSADGIGIPRRATMSVEIRFTEWVKGWMATLWGPGSIEFATSPSPAYVAVPSVFMVQCMITGRREVQQRGEYHA
ncbi:MAG: hypothetical protein A2Y72_07750 [Chloroflexi bacterium RBG_13_53_26]|nr:MAG: hypothetical protein A2Y72_07750 [Chloroflexi bacterium RBG_13_53_26]